MITKSPTGTGAGARGAGLRDTFQSSYVLSARSCRYIVIVSRVVRLGECEMPAAQAMAGDFDPGVCPALHALFDQARDAIQQMTAGHGHGFHAGPWDKGRGRHK